MFFPSEGITKVVNAFVIPFLFFRVSPHGAFAGEKVISRDIKLGSYERNK